MSKNPPRRVLSIQSHVVSGYVGNKAAVFPLQLLGFDVDVVNSVHLSNHTGYPAGVKGDVLGGPQLRQVLQGLEQNGLLGQIGHILTGYIGSESFLEAVIDVVQHVRRQAKNNTDSCHHVRYVCDPVLGDHGKFYVPPGLVDVYRQRVIPLADVLTPNQFEAEQLTGIMVSDLNDAKKACQALHDMGPSLVVITSLVDDHHDDNDGGSNRNMYNNKRGNHSNGEETNTIAILASQRVSHTTISAAAAAPASPTTMPPPEPRRPPLCSTWLITCPVIPGRFTGTGDLCAALLLAHTATSSGGTGNVPVALEQVINTMFAVIKKTHEKSQTFPDPTAPMARELHLIQSKLIIEHPPQRFRAVRLQ